MLAEHLSDTIIVRDDAVRASFDLLEHMWVEEGNSSDWQKLHHLHYKQQTLPIGPHFWKLTLYGETIGVLVTGVPKGMIRERFVAFPKLKPKSGDSKMINTQRYRWTNVNMRVVARFVVDTMYRGVGCGYRFLNLACRMEGKRFMEIQSSMSKFNVFAVKAGFDFVPPTTANSFDKGLAFLLSTFEAKPQDCEGILEELATKPAYLRDKLIREAKKFYKSISVLENTGNNRNGYGDYRIEKMTARDVIKAIQQASLASPMYGVFANPDVGRPLRSRLPLTAFDEQGPREPLGGAWLVE